jgi:hypothetical protein
LAIGKRRAKSPQDLGFQDYPNVRLLDWFSIKAFSLGYANVVPKTCWLWLSNDFQGNALPAESNPVRV